MALRRMVAQLVLAPTNEGIWLIDAQARTSFVNRHTAELLGYTEDEIHAVLRSRSSAAERPEFW